MKFIFLLLFTFIIKISSAQQLEYLWHRGDNAGNNGRVECVAYSSDNSLFMSVSHNGLIDADPSIYDTLLGQGGGSYSHTLIKYDAQRRYIWAVNWLTSFTMVGLTIDENNNAIYCYGNFNSVFDANPDTAISILNVGGSQGSSFIIKLNLDGKFQWAREIISTDMVSIKRLDVDDLGNLYMTGTYNGNMDADPSNDVVIHNQINWNDLYVIKWDLDGNYLRSFVIGGLYHDKAYDINVFGGTVFLHGTVYSMVDIDPSVGVVNINSTGGTKMFVAKYDTSFAYLNSVVWKSNDQNIGSHHMAVNDSGDVVIFGLFNIDFDVDPGPDTTMVSGLNPTKQSAFLIKIDSSLQFQFGFSIPNGYSMMPTEIKINDEGNIFIAGNFRGLFDFDPSPSSVFNLVNNQSINNIFIAWYDNLGNLVSAHAIENQYDKACEDICIGTNTICVGGYIPSPVDIDPTQDTLNVKYTSRYLTIEYSTCTPIVINYKDTICEGEDVILGDKNYFETGNYYYRFIREDACDSLVYLNLTVVKPNINVTFTNDTIKAVDLNSLTYQWYNCKEQLAIIGENNNYYVPTNNDPYSVIVTKSGCIDTSDCKQIMQNSNIGVPEFAWGDKIEGGRWGGDHNITIDQYGNIYVVGSFEGLTDVELFDGVTEIYETASSTDLMILKYNNDGELQWAYTAAAGIVSVAVNTNGDVYFAGNFATDFDIDADESNKLELKVSSSFVCCYYDVFFGKLNSSGQLLWVKSFGSGNSSDEVKSMAIDENGNIGIAGNTTYGVALDLDPSSNVFNVNGGAYIAKYDSVGNLIGGLGINPSNSFPTDGIGSSSVDFDGEGNLIATGIFSGNTDFDPGTGQLILSASSSDHQIFLASYDQNFELNWAKKFNSISNLEPYLHLSVDNQNNIYLLGYSYGKIDFTGNGSNYQSRYGTFLVKYNQTGNLLRVYPYNGASTHGLAIALDEFSNIYIVGQSNSNTTIQVDASSVLSETTPFTYVIKYNNDASENWAFTIKDGGNTYLPGIAPDNQGNIFLLGGGFGSSASFDINPSILDTFLISTSYAYIAKYGTGCSPVNTNTQSSTNSLEVDSGAYYIWKKCADNSIIEEGFDNLFEPVIEDDYYGVVLMGSCIDSTNCFHVTPLNVSINEIESNLWKTYPNPITNKLIIENKTNNARTYCLYNLLGVKIKCIEIKDVGEMIIPNLPKGAYLIKDEEGNIQKIIKI